MNNSDKDQEQVYQCCECGSLHGEREIASRPVSRVLYCDQCNSENVALVTS